VPTPSVPSVPGLPGGGSTPTTPPVVTVPDVPGVGVELCAKVDVADHPLIDTCVKDGSTTATTTPAKHASSSSADPAKSVTVTEHATAGGAPTSTSGPSSGGGSLARTGSDLGTPVTVGAALLTLGGLAFAASRFLPRLLERGALR
jgi:hypothetical protein